MTAIQLISKQTTEAYQWIHTLIDTVEEQQWEETPDILESNISWQIGHLVISIYYHTILVIKGHQEDVLQQLPLKKYSELYAYNTDVAAATGKLSPQVLKAHLAIVAQKSIAIIDSLTPEALAEPLIPREVVHPVATTKLEALSWNIQHTMWHCGQIASLKRVLGNPHRFELKKTNTTD